MFFLGILGNQGAQIPYTALNIKINVALLSTLTGIFRLTAREFGIGILGKRIKLNGTSPPCRARSRGCASLLATRPRRPWYSGAS